MQLKELKREIEALPNLDKELQGFQENWVKPFLSQSGKNKITDKNSPLHALNDLKQGEQEEVHSMILDAHSQFDELKYGQFTNVKMQSLAKAMIDLKLLEFQYKNSGDAGKDSKEEMVKSLTASSKYKYLTSKVLHDEFGSLQKTIHEIKAFDSQLQRLEETYNEVNQYLYQKLPLEHSVGLMDMGHKDNLKNLKMASRRRKALIKKLGKNFIALQNQLRGRGQSPGAEKKLDLVHD